jgi:hypothetical protein
VRNTRGAALGKPLGSAFEVVLSNAPLCNAGTFTR